MDRNSKAWKSTIAILGCVYRPPSASVGAWVQFGDFVENCARLRPRSDVILTGDFNVDFLNPLHPTSPNYSPRSILKTMHSTPTRISPQRNSCLDLFITTNDLKITSCQVVPAETVNTDHDLILSSLPTVSRPSPSASSRPSRATSKINFDILSQDLQNSNLN